MTDLRPDSRRFAGGPDADDLRRWVRDGLTDQEIGELVGRLHNTDPATKQAVQYWRKKNNVVRPKTKADSLDHAEVRPWRVKLEHTGDGIEHRLYDYSRRRQGRALSEQAERLLEDFLATLAEHDLVVDYNPDTPNGWLFRRRASTDDPDNIIRRPATPQK